jgi:hypothetical protein
MGSLTHMRAPPLAAVTTVQERTSLVKPAEVQAAFLREVAGTTAVNAVLAAGAGPSAKGAADG